MLSDGLPAQFAAAAGIAASSRITHDGLAAYWNAWGRGSFTSTRSASARSILADLTPHLAAAAQASDDAGELIVSFDRLVRQLSVGAHLFATLAADPSALHTLLQLVTRAPRLAPTIAERPDVFDALIDRQPTADVLPAADLNRALTQLKLGCPSDAELLRRIQRFTRKHQFLIGARAILGSMPIAKAECAYSRLALAVVQALAALAERKFQRRHGRVPGSEWALVALGKFGGCELTAISDLDLMLVYDCSGDEPCSDAPRPLPTSQYFNLLAQTVVGVLGARDSDGPLFEVDLRLRPWGNKGPLATRLSTLRCYLEQDAWTYERMAMTRARVITGTPQLAAAIESALRAALHRPADREVVRTDMLEMRALVHATKATTNPWDIKQVRGGLVDIEFIAQYLMLRHAQERPEIVCTSTADALAQLRSAGILGAGDFGILSDALATFKSVLQATRIACLSGALPESISSAFASCLPAMVGESSLNAVAARLVRHQAAVQETFDRLTAA
jgi:[glutamine synthetase] adenylyltransferase / [glutamine synthetase]-adenylyl-L-tyrosine phosphorylase